MKDLIKQIVKFIASETISKLVSLFIAFITGAILLFGIGSTLYFMYKASEATEIKIEKAQSDGCEYLGMIESGKVEFYECNDKIEMKKVNFN